MMIPKRMDEYLHDVLPLRTWQRRRKQFGFGVYMEFGPLDVDRLQRLGIQVDSLGPRLVVCMWDEESPYEIGGYLVVDNLAMGKPSMGGIRMRPDLNPAIIHNLARGMTLKNAAADLPFGGGKAGLVAGDGLEDDIRHEVVRRFARLIARYKDIYNPGPDVGTNDSDMKTIAIENGLDCVLSKPVEMGGARIDELGAAAGGIVIAIDSLLGELSRLKTLPQFRNMPLPTSKEISVTLQGFGAVGANIARILHELGPGNPRVVGVSDEQGYLYSPAGLPVDKLLELHKGNMLVTFPFFERYLSQALGIDPATVYSNKPANLLREAAFCFVPAAPVANYLDTEAYTNPTMTVDQMGCWQMIVEAANTYSPDPVRKKGRARMEREVYHRRGVLIAPDYLVNSGGVIFAAHELLIKTPDQLRIPQEMLGNPEAVEDWLIRHAAEFEALAEQRRVSASARREEVIRRNMKQLIDILISDGDILPCEAAERISVSRIASSESFRTAEEVMASLLSLPQNSTIHDAAQLLVDTGADIIAVVAEGGELQGVLTDWDITRASAAGFTTDTPVEKIMTREVITCSPADGILEVVKKLEQYEISAMPVVQQGRVIGCISGDLLARRTLFRLLQSRSAG
jgi:glutamate dehydrogenase/leucine dehydrogenase